MQIEKWRWSSSDFEFKYPGLGRKMFLIVEFSEGNNTNVQLINFFFLVFLAHCFFSGLTVSTTDIPVGTSTQFSPVWEALQVSQESFSGNKTEICWRRRRRIKFFSLLFCTLEIDFYVFSTCMSFLEIQWVALISITLKLLKSELLRLYCINWLH